MIALLGPTASGKSAAALALAERCPVEIVSMDSAQVYRGMDIGTAKPTAQERARVPHHLIDLIEPSESYSAARFAMDARAAIADIQARGRLPLLVGGTMLYLRALRGGLSPLPAANAAVRERLDAQARELGWPGLHRRLATLDPATAARLDPNDAQRIQRALEIIELTGRPVSELLASADAPPGRRGDDDGGGDDDGNDGGSADGAGADDDWLLLSLEPSDRPVLHQRLADRFDAMLAAGLLDEVRGLRARGDLTPRMPSMRCVGYRQSWSYLDGAIDHETLRAQGIAASRQLAKRQLTWLRAMPQRQVIDCLAGDASQRVIESALRWLERHR